MELSVVGFNIRSCNDPEGNSIPERAPRLAKVLKDYDADVICLQEFTPKWESFMDLLTRGEYAYLHKYRNETVDIEGSPILWKKEKFQCLKTGWFWLSDTPEVESRGWDALYNCYRMCLYAVLQEKATGKVFTVMNTHFGFGDEGQVASAELITKYAQTVAEGPVVLLGDFNMTPSTPGYGKITEYFTDVNMATAKDENITFHAYNKRQGYLIDFCFVDSTVTPLGCKRITDLVDGKFPSDHYGIYANLEL